MANHPNRARRANAGRRVRLLADARRFLGKATGATDLVMWQLFLRSAGQSLQRAGGSNAVARLVLEIEAAMAAPDTEFAMRAAADVHKLIEREQAEQS